MYAALIRNTILSGGLGKVSCVVIDGITLGHPCCSVHNCKIPLTRQRDRFCSQHAAEASKCSVKGCGQPVTKGSRVCGDQAHIEVERKYVEHGQTRFHDLQRLVNSNVVSLNNNVPDITDPSILGDLLDDSDVLEFDIDRHGNVSQPGTSSTGTKPPPAGRRRITARFGRARTHNEQIIVGCCGLIIGRVTFYGAEAVTSVIVGIVLP